MIRLYVIFLFSLIFSNEGNVKYLDLEGNELIYKNKKWSYKIIPVADCTIPFNVFANYIAENSDIEFLNKQEAYRYGVYRMPHMDICPPLDYEPYVYPINAEYQIKSTWDSLKVGMSQKQVREWMKFDPMITYSKNKIKYWEYNKFGFLEFDQKGKLLNWKFKGRDDQSIYIPHKREVYDSESNEKKWFKIKKKSIKLYCSVKEKILSIFKK